MGGNMLKNLFFAFLVAAVAACVSYAEQSSPKVIVQTPKTAATDGKTMYVNYCASCHGVNGKGAGPVAPALKTQPADLTVLSKTNAGRFPAIHVISVLQFGAAAPAHGSAEMPVWGPILGKMNPSFPQEKALRISNLSHYLESIQVK
jgi:mono/diheme cytochrome c family protein